MKAASRTLFVLPVITIVRSSAVITWRLVTSTCRCRLTSNASLSDVAESEKSDALVPSVIRRHCDSWSASSARLLKAIT
jgi:hypothetical protein